MSEHDRQGVLLQGVAAKPVRVAFDDPTATTNGGALLLGILDRRLRLSEALAGAIVDHRQAGKVRHEIGELVRQRLHGLACGYGDCNDASRIAADPALRMLIGLEEEAPPASQPTLSRFETRTTPQDIVRLLDAMADAVLGRHRSRLGKKVRRITIDIDLTDDLTYGTQQMALFNSHYGGWCYMPLLVFVSFDDEPEQYLIASVLRPGRSPKAGEVVELMSFVLSAVRRHFKHARLMLRADGGFTSGTLIEYLEGEGVDYLLGMPRNAVLETRAEELMMLARLASEHTGKTEAFFDETTYDGRKWTPADRRVVIKAEVTRLHGREPRDNPRFVITSMKRRSPERIYELYRMRGDVENRIKELKDDMDLGRTSCASVDANQLRLILSSAAFALLQELRLHVARTLGQRPSARSLRDRLLKIGGRVIASARRFVFQLAASHPWQNDWLRVARALGASSA